MDQDDEKQKDEKTDHAAVANAKAFVAFYERNKSTFPSKAIEDQAEWCSLGTKMIILNHGDVPQVMRDLLKDGFAKLEKLMRS